jgi:RNA-directed DNA polymerase
MILLAGLMICSTSSMTRPRSWWRGVAWRRVRGNKGKRSGGVDGIAPVDVADVAELLAALRDDVKTGVFVPLPARERMIPKAGGKLRRLGIATVRDRVAQAALKLVLEPIFEADFHPCS